MLWANDCADRNAKGVANGNFLQMALCRRGWPRDAREMRGNELGESSNNNVLGERNSVLGERNSLLEERNSVVEERNSVLEERNSLLEERNSVVEERNSVLEESNSVLTAAGGKELLLVVLALETWMLADRTLGQRKITHSIASRPTMDFSEPQWKNNCANGRKWP